MKRRKRKKGDRRMKLIGEKEERRKRKHKGEAKER